MRVEDIEARHAGPISFGNETAELTAPSGSVPPTKPIDGDGWIADGSEWTYRDGKTHRVEPVDAEPPKIINNIDFNQLAGAESQCRLSYAYKGFVYHYVSSMNRWERK